MFKTPLRSEATSPGRWELIDPLVYEMEGGAQITVPRGFETDFASIPRALQVLPSFGVNGRSREPAVLHDYLYAQKGECVLDYWHGLVNECFSRAEVDEIFRGALVAVGVNRLAPWLFWAGVRAGGWLAWSRPTRAAAL